MAKATFQLCFSKALKLKCVNSLLKLARPWTRQKLSSCLSTLSGCCFVELGYSDGDAECAN